MRAQRDHLISVPWYEFGSGSVEMCCLILPMVLILDVYSEILAHVWRDLAYSISSNAFVKIEGNRISDFVSSHVRSNLF